MKLDLSLAAQQHGDVLSGLGVQYPRGMLAKRGVYHSEPPLRELCRPVLDLVECQLVIAMTSCQTFRPITMQLSISLDHSMVGALTGDEICLTLSV